VRLSGKVHQRVNTLTNEMEAIWVPLAVETLKVIAPPDQKPMCSKHLIL